MVQISLAFGLAVAVGVQINGPISGGYLNPAVTLAGLVAGRLSLIRSMLFVIFQIIGGIGSLFLNNLMLLFQSEFWPKFYSNRNSVSHRIQFEFEFRDYLLFFTKKIVSSRGDVIRLRICTSRISVGILEAAGSA